MAAKIGGRKGWKTLEVECPECANVFKEVFMHIPKGKGMYYVCSCGFRVKIRKGETYKQYKHRYVYV